MWSVFFPAHLLSIGLLLFCVTACGGSRELFSPNRPDFANPRIIDSGDYPQCVPYAREVSGIEIYGDAVAWWDMASAKYHRASRPASGSVLVLVGYNDAKRGHLLVVRRVVSSREIVVDHANWLNRGEVELDQPVVDVSGNNDWSEVRVWHSPSGQYGTRVYKARGFILPTGPDVAAADIDPPTDDSVCVFVKSSS
jgi:surface antigen